MTEVSDTTAEYMDALRMDSANAQDLADIAELAELEAEEAEEEDEIEEYEERKDSSDGWENLFYQSQARNTVLEAALSARNDSEDEEEEFTEEEFEEFVEDNIDAIMDSDAAQDYLDARLDSVIEVMGQARPYLPGDYEMKGSSDPHDIKAAALANHFDSEEVGIDLEDEGQVNGAFSLLVKSGAARQDSMPADPTQRLRNDMGGGYRKDMAHPGKGHKSMEVSLRRKRRQRQSDF